MILDMVNLLCSGNYLDGVPDSPKEQRCPQNFYPMRSPSVEDSNDSCMLVLFIILVMKNLLIR